MRFANSIGAPITAGEPFPMSFNDPMFVGMTDFTTGNPAAATLTLGPGESVSNGTFQNNTDSVEINCGGGGNTVTLCRTFSREGIRISENGVHIIDRCWIETYGIGGDHADGVQTFPAKTTDITIRKTTFRTYSEAETIPPPGDIGAVGAFLSDGNVGNVLFEDVLFLGGRVAFRITSGPSGTDVVNVRLRRVYLVGPFSQFDFECGSAGSPGGTLNVLEWVDVYNATVVSGRVVRGSAIPPP